MKTRVRLLAILLLAPMMGLAQAFEPGQDYTVLDEPVSTSADGGKVEVREFFSYACPHCHTFRPRIESLMERIDDKAELVHNPVVFNQSWEPLARAYYVTRSMGVVDDTHAAIFNALHEENRQPGSAEALADIVAEQGGDKDEFLDGWNSFSVDSDMRRGERAASAHGVRSTPTVGVAGKYVVDVRAAGGQERMLDIIEYLVEKEYNDGQ